MLTNFVLHFHDEILEVYSHFQWTYVHWCLWSDCGCRLEKLSQVLGKMRTSAHSPSCSAHFHCPLHPTYVYPICSEAPSGRKEKRKIKNECRRIQCRNILTNKLIADSGKAKGLKCTSWSYLLITPDCLKKGEKNSTVQAKCSIYRCIWCSSALATWLYYFVNLLKPIRDWILLCSGGGFTWSIV